MTLVGHFLKLFGYVRLKDLGYELTPAGRIVEVQSVTDDRFEPPPWQPAVWDNPTALLPPAPPRLAAPPVAARIAPAPPPTPGSEFRALPPLFDVSLAVTGEIPSPDQNRTVDPDEHDTSVVEADLEPVAVAAARSSTAPAAEGEDADEDLSDEEWEWRLAVARAREQGDLAAAAAASAEPESSTEAEVAAAPAAVEPARPRPVRSGTEPLASAPRVLPATRPRLFSPPVPSGTTGRAARGTVPHTRLASIDEDASTEITVAPDTRDDDTRVTPMALPPDDELTATTVIAAGPTGTTRPRLTVLSGSAASLPRLSARSRRT